MRPRQSGLAGGPRELIRRDITTKVTGLCALAQQVSNHLAELVLRSGNLVVSMQEHHELGFMVPSGFVEDERKSLQHSFESLASAAGLVPDLGEICEVTSDLTLVPGEQDRFDV